MVPVGDDDLADSSLQLLQRLLEQTDILWLVWLTSVNQDTAAQGEYTCTLLTTVMDTLNMLYTGSLPM